MRFIFLLLTSLLVFNLSAQEECNNTIFGTVIDEHDGSKLEFATIWIPSQQRGVAADEQGSFVLPNVCDGEIAIIARHIGCEPDTFMVEVKDSMNLTLFLEHHIELLEQVEISDDLDETGTIRFELEEEQLAENRGKPLGEIMSSMNGVSSLSTGANISKPVISGFSGNRVQILNQGVQLQSQSWGDEHAPEVDPFSASEYSLVKGASGLKYAGGSLGGLIIASSKPLPRTAGINGELNALGATNNRMGNGSLMLEGNSEWASKFSWRVQGSAKRSGNIRSPNYYQKNTGVSEVNGSGELGYFEEKWNAKLFYSQFNSEIGIFSGAHIGNLTDLQNAIKRTEPRSMDQEGFSYEIRRPYQRIIHELTKVEFNWYPAAFGKINVTLSRQFNVREEFDKERPRNRELAALNIPEFSLGMETYSANVNATVRQKGNFKTEFGGQLMLISNSVNSFTDFIPDYDNSILSFYLVEKWKKGKLGLESGIRLDQNYMNVSKLVSREFNQFEHDFTAWTAHLGMAYELRPSTTLRTAATYAERPPAINELYSDGLHHGSASLEFGDNSLGKESSYGLSAELESVNDEWSYSLYGYLQYVEDFIYLTPTGFDLTIRGAFPSFQWKNTNALVRGLDQSISYEWSEKWQIGNKLSFIWGDNLEANNFLINMPQNQIQNYIQYQQRINKVKMRLKVSDQLVFAQDRFNPTEEIAVPPDGYHLFNIYLSASIQLKEKKRLELGLNAENILNTVYRNYLNRFRFYADEQGRNLTLTINYKF